MMCVMKSLRHCLQPHAGLALDRLRQQPVAPVMGIIKARLDFRRFSLRGVAVVAPEWTLVCVADNFSRCHRRAVVTA